VLELGQHLVASCFIVDPAIPTLSAVLDPAELGEHLRQFLFQQTKGLQEIQVRSLRHHAGKRCVVEVTLRTAQGWRCWMGKVYARDRSDVYRLMEGVRRAGWGPDEEFSIPQPIAYLQELQLLLQEKVEGQAATEWFLSDDESERTAAAERCARWLAKFHAIAPGMAPSLDRSSQLLSIERWFHRVASLGEPFAGKAGELFKRLEVAASKLRPAEMCTIHGDYTHHQAILAQGRTVTVDWDDYELADPSHDVARFTVGLQRLALRCRGSIQALDGAVEVFLNTYFSGYGPEAMRNLPFHKAAICLQLAKKDIRHRAVRWHEKAEATLDEGLRVLEPES
jgi:aminoglycoside phosphotransferase (APT) family kinase protein